MKVILHWKEFERNMFVVIIVILIAIEVIVKEAIKSLCDELSKLEFLCTIMVIPSEGYI